MYMLFFFLYIVNNLSNLRCFTKILAISDITYFYLTIREFISRHYKKNGLLRRSKSAAKDQKSAAKGTFDL